ncbi:diguanylate cyclase [Actinotalea sp. JY-7876]|nr:GGDEF domain-containing protein [Actinotalea sp. JY-7876]
MTSPRASAGAEHAPDLGAVVRGNLQQQSRYVIAIAIAIGIPTMVVVALTAPEPDPVVRYGYPPVIAYLLVYAWVLVRRPAMAVPFSRITLVLFELAWITTMAAGLARASDLDAAWAALFPLFFLSMVIFLIVGYLFFSARQGAVHAGAVVLAVFAAGSAGALAADDGARLVPHVLRYCIYLAVIAVLLLVLSQAKTRLALALVAAQQARAEVSEMRDMAYLDALTGVANRRRLVEELSFRSSRVGPGYPVALVYFDLDRFKSINDDHGHAVGDDVLRRVASLASGVAGRDAVVGRLGGEEFVVVAPGATHADALDLAERLRQSLPREVGADLGVPVTASFGVSMLRPGESASVALARADELMYDAKAGGRDRVVGGAMA